MGGGTSNGRVQSLLVVLTLIGGLTIGIPTAASGGEITIQGRAPEDIWTGIGPRILLHSGGPVTIPIGEPFWIQHGWSMGSCEAPLLKAGPDTRFDLYLDGHRVSARVQEGCVYIPAADVSSYSKLSFYQFPSRQFPRILRGTHTFYGEFWLQGELSFSVTLEVIFE